jgi:hypothetical protein
MNPLVQYYLRQGGRGVGDGDIGPIYHIPPFVQREHGIGSFLSGLWRSIGPLLWSGAKSIGKETLRTGGKILTDIVENQSPDVSTHDIISKNLSESTQNLISNLRGRGRKRKRTTRKAKASKSKTKNKNAKRILNHSLPDHVCKRSLRQL